MARVHVRQVEVRVRGVSLADVRRGGRSLASAVERALGDQRPAGSKAALADRIASPLSAAIQRAVRGAR